MKKRARALLALLTEELGTDGVLKIDTIQGADLPPGSTRSRGASALGTAVTTLRTGRGS